MKFFSLGRGGCQVRAIPFKDLAAELKAVSYSGDTESLRDRYKIIVDKYYLTKDLDQAKETQPKKENKFKL